MVTLRLLADPKTGAVALLVVLLTLISCERRGPAKEGSVEQIQMSRDTVGTELPAEVLNCVRRQFQGWALPSIAEFDTAWNDYAEGNAQPSYCSSDFTGDGWKDFAVLLRSESKDKVLLMAALVTPSLVRAVPIGSFDVSTDKLDLGLAIAEKGLWEGIDGQLSVPNDGICLTSFNESRGVSYHWNGNRFLPFISD